MKQPLSKVLLFSFVLLGIAFSGVGNLTRMSWPGPLEGTQSVLQAQNQLQVSSTPPPSPTPSPTLPHQLQPPTVQAGGTTVYAFIEAPDGPLSTPYVLVFGFQARTFSPSISIVGTLNTADFACAGSPCTLPLQLGESRIVFRAVLPSGEASETVFARVFTSMEQDGYHVTIESVSQFFGAFTDSCLKIWEIEDESFPSWAEFPPFPYELNTQITLHQLAARLIVNGAVDSRDCPAGGLSGDLSWPNGCGLERARDKMIEWQNKYDDAIWSAANDVGIPPKILKTLIQVESQFWPGNGRFYMDEYGLGQLNELGMDVLLRQDNALYQQACSAVLTNCTTPYVSLSPVEQAMVRRALLGTLDASCATCENGVDITRARQSISFIAQVLRANCRQVKTILDERSATSDYESLWKFTLLSYHSGTFCLAEAVKDVKQANEPMDWVHVADQLSCGGGAKYVNGVWTNLTLFDRYRYTAGPSPLVQFSPIFA
ncbi:MAG: hypothetical protein ACM3QS_15870, partial [Bacteroidota bacterium]